jgi:hypothetical protein
MTPQSNQTEGKTTALLMLLVLADGNPQHITIAMKDIQIEIHKARYLWLT